MNSRASLAGAFCCTWYPVCTTKTGISIMSFRSADRYIGHMLTHMDCDSVFTIADLCRDLTLQTQGLAQGQVHVHSHQEGHFQTYLGHSV